MKKFFGLMILCILVIFTLNFTVQSSDYNDNLFKYSSNSQSNNVQQSIASKIIRFHVIANSDTQSDQALKLKVRDEVLKYISPKLSNSKSIAESRQILKENNNNILSIARKVIRERGYSYGVTSTLSQFNFPIKTYGNITLPQGKYEAYRIIIGQGKGRNWWCVMFPPLCFVDISKGQASYKKTEKEMKTVLNQKEYNSVDNGIENLNNNKKNNDNNVKDNNIEVRFKILDIVKGLGF
ncbi:MAG: stage II sporulation protein R [Clostridium tyrobutyricum]|jgi:stage II sporulation protein R|uniref:stage II sporulation protein R n=2 Tax=Clostridium tyrobutyricum TaxID=1519 RepID=UPI0018AC18B5|nr:stage II sporulation protein R [Clostridium tyrobutyricum]MCH4236366.1 stage II sporulation protein R [Clostridium tyrobutyricum]MCH4258475.1 stage II sporulation protein R [Clostridium tyrobutyricum]MCI1238564.1 stage II sporulation protein R [Clostridium tyrobutyricum]MCI1653424.1 stage II sporulation protein R [Clostridium tyrobutyricum]MCI1992056.1 stage II sporulation protein R [Clostridium tyrobutyricum]